MAQFGWTIYIGYIGFSIGRTFVDFVGKKKTTIRFVPAPRQAAGSCWFVGFESKGLTEEQKRNKTLVSRQDTLKLDLVAMTLTVN